MNGPTRLSRPNTPPSDFKKTNTNVASASAASLSASISTAPPVSRARTSASSSESSSISSNEPPCCTSTSSPFERVAAPPSAREVGNLYRLDEHRRQPMGFDIKSIGSSGGGGGGLVLTPQPQLDKIKLRGGGGGLDSKNFNLTPSVMEADNGGAGGKGREKTVTPSPTDGEDETSSREGTPNPKSSGGKDEAADSRAETIFNSKIAFPLNLTRMLEAVEPNGWEDIVRWGEDEKNFVIKDIDRFLAEVLPKFFKSSENTKIRSFYRKLNRWGFSMSRKKANNPYNVWSHPDYQRKSAVKALEEALEKGKAVDFLNMSSITRGRKRRGTEDTKDCGSEEDDVNSFLNGSFISRDSFNGGDLFNPLSRSASNSSWAAGNLASIASMPILPSARTSFSNLNKRVRGGQGMTSGLSSKTKLNQLGGGLQRPGAKQPGGRRLLSQSYTTNNLGGLGRAQSTQIMGTQGNANATFDQLGGQGSGNANATFDLSALTQGAGGGSSNVFSNLLSRPMSSGPSNVAGVSNSAFNNTLSPRPASSGPSNFSGGTNATFNNTLSRPTSSGPANATLDLSSLTQALGSTGSGNPTFDLSALLPQTTTGGSLNNNSPFNQVLPTRASAGIVPNTSNFAPSSNPFARSAQEMLNQGNCASVDHDNIDARMSLGNRLNGNKNAHSLLGRESAYPHRRQLLQREMTPDEDSELMDFLGNFAETLPPPQEDDEEGGEPDPIR